MMNTYVQIVKKETDTAGMVRIWVELSDGSWFMTKWDTDPSDACVEEYVNNFMLSQAAALEV